MSTKTNRSVIVTGLIAAAVVVIAREGFAFVATAARSASIVAGGGAPDPQEALRWYLGAMMLWALLFGAVVNILVGAWIARRRQHWAGAVFLSSALIAVVGVAEVLLMGGQIAQAAASAAAASQPGFKIGLAIGAALGPFLMSLILLSIGAAIGGMFRPKPTRRTTPAFDLPEA